MMTSIDSKRASERLNVEAALGNLAPNGSLALALKGFESRDEQKQMMRNILEAYNYNHISLIEAGTGTGKSLAYLIPAMLWAAQTKERTVISTNTITLQEQLLHKDIPLIEKALNLNVKAVLVKGMHNYLCMRKLEEALQESFLLTPQESEEIQRIDAWKDVALEGSRSSMPFSPSPGVWEKVGAETDTCNRNACPYYQQCHFFKARRQANEGQLLIVNHHLLFADLVRRIENDDFTDVAILPPYSRIILDEAHNIEDTATEYFASHVSQMDIMRQMARLTSEKGGKPHGKLVLLKEKMVQCYKKDFSEKITSIYNRLNIDIAGMRRDVLQQSHETFGAFLEFAQMMQSYIKETQEGHVGESKLRILPRHATHMHWKERLVPRAKQLQEAILRFSQALTALIEDLKQLKNQQLDEQIKGITFEIGALVNRLISSAAIIERFIDVLPQSKVRWIELQPLKTMINTSLVDAELDISQMLADFLFSKFHTVVLCSATLTTNKHFQFIRSRLGLNSEKLQNRIVKEYIYDSPFDFLKQVMLAIPTDLPNPSEASFVQVAVEKIWQALLSSRGNAFVLFTSYTMLKLCFEKLEKRMREQRFNPLKQGDDDRQILLNKFKSIDKSVLFGTDSFWEGVDVVGDALRCVIIVKLPFKVPSEPLIQARSEAILANGGDPFMDYSLPQAIVKFKQGFGRLIRNRRDRGCIVCLDNRITTKKYGKLFLSSLPECQYVVGPIDTLQREMTDFYRRTHFLVC